MADQQQLDLLRQGVSIWNTWRQSHPDIDINLTDADLTKANLSHADLMGADLTKTNLTEADLSFTDLSFTDLSFATFRRANLSLANLRGAILKGASFYGAILRGVDLSRATLLGAILSETTLRGTDLSYAHIGWLIFGDVDLRTVKGLETVDHQGPSTIGIDTVSCSAGNIPEVFLRGAGVPDIFIDSARSLVQNPTKYYSCFISYSSKDQEFAERLDTDLQHKGVRCWFAPEDMKTGDKIRHRIYESIGLHDKLLLLLSEHSVASTWVEDEVEIALAIEKSRNATVLFPIRLDTTVKESTTSWAAHIRDTRQITNFTHWKQHDEYQKAFKRLLRDLQIGIPPKKVQ